MPGSQPRGKMMGSDRLLPMRRLLLAVFLGSLLATGALAEPYPAYIERQIERGTLSPEEAQMLLKAGLGTPAPRAARRQRTPVNPIYDLAEAAMAESEYNEMLNRKRYASLAPAAAPKALRGRGYRRPTPYGYRFIRR